MLNGIPDPILHDALQGSLFCGLLQGLFHCGLQDFLSLRFLKRLLRRLLNLFFYNMLRCFLYGVLQGLLYRFLHRLLYRVLYCILHRLLCHVGILPGSGEGLSVNSLASSGPIVSLVA